MFAPLRRHPFAVEAFFSHSLVLTYALSAEVLLPLLPPGLVLDQHKNYGLLAVALVQTRKLRPAFLPHWLGQSFFLAGYRLFVKFKSRSGRTLRGLHIIRSYTDRRLMVVAGNCLTHYRYVLASATVEEAEQRLVIRTRTPNQEADIEIIADLSEEAKNLPDGSPFDNFQEARRFAGPLPYTFDYEVETHSIIIIEGQRENWDPKPIHVTVNRNTFLDRFVSQGQQPVLASAFHVRDIPYRWLRGRREKLGGPTVA